MCSTTDVIETGTGCAFNNCQVPTVTGPTFDVLPQGGGVFTVRMVMTVVSPWNEYYASSLPNNTLDMIWFDVSPAPAPFTSGGDPSLCEYLSSDKVHTYVEETGLTCSGAPYSFGTYSLRSSTCGGPCFTYPSCPGWCGKLTDNNGLDFTVTAAMLGCPSPKKWSCPSEGSCPTCGCTDGPSGPAGSGPGATLRYAAGGAGGTGFPAPPPGLRRSAATGRTTTPSAS